MRRLAVMLIILAQIGLSPAWGQTAVPPLLSYQGQLLSSGGAPITTSTSVRFTLLWGGTANENPSTGKPVYQEDVTLIPDGSGVFHHLIGAGAPTGGCDENRDGTAAEPCVLASDDFPNASTVVYLELRIDPAGANNLLAPRQRIASVAYALNAATLGGQAAADFITAVSPGSGLEGGGTTGDVTVAIAAGGVTGTHLAANSVGATQIQTGAVGASEIAPSAVTNSALFPEAVTGDKIRSGTVTATHLAANSVGATQIQTGAVGSSEIADLAVSDADLAFLAVTSNKIASGAVQFTHMAADSVGATHIRDNAVGTLELADNVAVTTVDIAPGAVTNAKLALTPTLTADFATSSTTESFNNLGGFKFCALAKEQLVSLTNQATNIWCRVVPSGGSWFLGVRSNGTTTVTCQAVCF